MARSERSAAKVAAFGATPVACSLDNVDATALKGVDAIIHCAAFVEEWGTREQFWNANVVGTERLLAAAKEAGVKRFVHVGTIAALFVGKDLLEVDETAPYPAKHKYLYGETKQAAEERVLAANSSELTTLSLRPCFIWGPRDNSLLPGVKRMVDEGNWAWLDRGKAKVSTTNVFNLVHAIELALIQGNGGQAYFIADDRQRTLHEFITAIAADIDLELPSRSVPGFVARGAASVVEAAYRWTGRKSMPPLTRMAAALMSRSVTVNDAKARRELGYQPVDTAGATKKAA